MGHRGRCYRWISKYCLDNIARFITKRVPRPIGNWDHSQLCKYGHPGRAKCRRNKARVTFILDYRTKTKIILKKRRCLNLQATFFRPTSECNGYRPGEYRLLQGRHSLFCYDCPYKVTTISWRPKVNLQRGSASATRSIEH